jgi:hypothetical protein
MNFSKFSFWSLLIGIVIANISNKFIFKPTMAFPKGVELSCNNGEAMVLFGEIRCSKNNTAKILIPNTANTFNMEFDAVLKCVNGHIEKEKGVYICQ